MLLAVLDLFAAGAISGNLIEPNQELARLFMSYSRRIMKKGHPERVFVPFIHLRAEGFWHLVPLPGHEQSLAKLEEVWSMAALREHVLGAKLDDELYPLLQTEDGRELLRRVLVETHFSPPVQAELMQQGIINRGIFRYSETVLDEARGVDIREREEHIEAYHAQIKGEGFRRAVLIAYGYRCALCGIRVLTASGESAVDATRIMPIEVEPDDRPVNCLALCPLCRWAFNVGLAGISARYTVLVARQLTAEGNVPGHLMTLSGRGILGPEEPQLWPDPEAVRWHRKEVYLG